MSMFYMIYGWTNGWASNRDAGALRCHRTHYDVTVMATYFSATYENKYEYIIIRFGIRFPPLSDAYDKELRELALEVLRDHDLRDHTHEGVYGMVAGPCYETVAEARMLRHMGADVTGTCWRTLNDDVTCMWEPHDDDVPSIWRHWYVINTSLVSKRIIVSVCSRYWTNGVEKVWHKTSWILQLWESTVI